MMLLAVAFILVTVGTAAGTSSLMLCNNTGVTHTYNKSIPINKFTVLSPNYPDSFNTSTACVVTFKNIPKNKNNVTLDILHECYEPTNRCRPKYQILAKSNKSSLHQSPYNCTNGTNFWTGFIETNDDGEFRLLLPPANGAAFNVLLIIGGSQSEASTAQCLTNGRTSPPPDENESLLSKMKKFFANTENIIIVAASGGGVLLLIIIIILVVKLAKKNKNGSHETTKPRTDSVKKYDAGYDSIDDNELTEKRGSDSTHTDDQVPSQDEQTDSDDKTHIPMTAERKSTSSKKYSQRYTNTDTILRREAEGTLEDMYAPIQKQQKKPGTEIDMMENDLYGSTAA